jgi:NADPH-dependent 2,4-dienoyl-CoA reductase/sulfur reductase-like enzyme
MEAARVSTERGHRAVIFEKSSELGGAILGCCVTPGKEKMRWYADWIRHQIADLGVEVQLCANPGPKDLGSYDVVVNATGAHSFVPEASGETESVIPFEEVLACPKVSCEFHPHDGRAPRKLEGTKVIVWGDGYPAADTATHLASIGKDVTVVTDQPEFASQVEVIHMYVLRKRFRQTDAEALSSKPFKFPVKERTGCTVNEIRKGEVVLIDRDLVRETVACDHVVTCWSRPDQTLARRMREAGLMVVSVGDAVRPRNLHAAVKEGADLGMVLDERSFFNPNNVFIDDLPRDIRGQLVR